MSTCSKRKMRHFSLNARQIDESNSLAESLKALKTFNLQSAYQPGFYVDALDSYDTWRVAKILAITKDDAAILTFDGWGSRWNETIKLKSSRIAPFKKITPPYTGAVKSARREFAFEDSRDLIANTIEQLYTITSQKIKVTDPEFINQYFRGNLYTLMDAVLSQGPLKSQTDLKLAVDLMEQYMDFFIEYLNVLPSLLKEYIDGRALNEPNLYLVNDKIGLVSCIPEVFDTMKKLFGGCPRLKLFSDNEFPNKYSLVLGPKEKYTQIIGNINYFGAHGFDKLIKLINWEQKFGSKTKSDPADKETVYRFPLHYIIWILQTISPTASLLKSPFKEKFGQELKTAFLGRIKRLTIQDLKDHETQVQSNSRKSSNF